MRETLKGDSLALSVWLHVATLVTLAHYYTHTYTLTRDTELYVCFTPTPHAHTLDCSAAENVFLILSPLTISLFLSFLSICDHLEAFQEGSFSAKKFKQSFLSLHSHYRGQ